MDLGFSEDMFSDLPVTQKEYQIRIYSANDSLVARNVLQPTGTGASVDGLYMEEGELFHFTVWSAETNEEYPFEVLEWQTLDFKSVPGEYHSTSIMRAIQGIIDFDNHTDIIAAGNNVLKVYPNPVSTQLYVNNIPADAVGIQIVDVKGAVVFSQQNNLSTDMLIDVAALTTGTYLLVVNGDNSTSLRFTKE